MTAPRKPRGKAREWWFCLEHESFTEAKTDCPGDDFAYEASDCDWVRVREVLPRPVKKKRNAARRRG